MFECIRCGATGNWVDQSPAAGKPFHLYDIDPTDIYGYHPDELCQGCHITLTDNIVLTTDISFSFYYSAASYTSRSVLEDQEESNILVSYRTQINGRVGPENHHFVDSGGDPQAFKTFDSPEYPSSHDDYLDYITETTTGPHDRWSLRDYPCAKAVLNKFDTTVEDLQRKTRDAHRELLDKAATRGIDAKPVSILQGTSVDEYLDHAIDLREHGVLTDYVAIGGIAGYGPERQQKLILAIREFLPARHRLHGLGVNLATLKLPGVLNALTSADSGNWYNRDAQAGTSSEWGWETHNRVNNRTVTYQYLDHTQRKNEILSNHYWAHKSDAQDNPQPLSSEPDTDQQTLTTLEENDSNTAMDTATQTPPVEADGGEKPPTINRSYMDLLDVPTRQILRRYQNSLEEMGPQQKDRATAQQTDFDTFSA